MRTLLSNLLKRSKSKQVAQSVAPITLDESETDQVEIDWTEIGEEKIKQVREESIDVNENKENNDVKICDYIDNYNRNRFVFFREKYGFLTPASDKEILAMPESKDSDIKHIQEILIYHIQIINNFTKTSIVNHKENIETLFSLYPDIIQEITPEIIIGLAFNYNISNNSGFKYPPDLYRDQYYESFYKDKIPACFLSNGEINSIGKAFLFAIIPIHQIELFDLSAVYPTFYTSTDVLINKLGLTLSQLFSESIGIKDYDKFMSIGRSDIDDIMG